MAADIGTGVATEVTSKIIAEVDQQLNKVIGLEKNRPVLNTDFSRMEGLLVHICNQFQSRQKRLPEPVKRCLERMNVAIREADNLINGARQQPERGWCLPAYRNPDHTSKITVWKARFEDLLQQLEMWFSISSNTEQIVSSGPLLLQAVPQSGFVGSGIQSARMQLQTWLAEPRGQARGGVIGVHGTGGVGKTSLLKIIYNTYRKEVSGFFDVLIWFTVSRSFEVEELQASIAEALNLSLEKTSPTEMPEILYASLKRKRFLLILDNLSSKIELDKVGVKTGDDNGSKILISSRSREVIDTMGARDYSLMIQPLSSEEGLELFRRGAFTNGDVPESNIEGIAKEIATDCNGLPLVINAVAAAMSFKKTTKEWTDALNLMRNTRSSVSRNQRTTDPEPYPQLTWSYNELSDSNLKICFLNCAAFLEDKEIVVETLVEMWEAEGLLNGAKTDTPYLMDAGRLFINVLVSRCLLESVEYIVDDDYHSVEYVKIHEVLRDTAIEIGQREENCLFVAGKQSQRFPSEEDTRNCKRISIAHNAIQNLPDNLKCGELSSLVLASNIHLEHVPQGFLSNVTSLKVLDLSCTSIGTLPTSVETLAELKFLNLSKCSKLVGLPEALCKLTSLEVLNLNSCLALLSLPKKIEELKKLKHLKLDECYSLQGIPSNLCQLTSLNTLILPLMESTFAMSVEHLTSLSRLMELTAVVKLEIKSETQVDKMVAWQEMRNLTLEYDNDADADRDDIVPQHDTLRNMGKMKKLQNFHLINYQGETLPNSIRELQNLKMLLLRSCYQLKELPALANTDESGGVSALAKTEGGGVSALAETESAKTEIEGAPASDKTESGGVYFPMLEKLVLKNLLKLEKIAATSDGWNEKAMSKLQLLVIINCPLLKKLPEGMKLPHLKELHITMCNELMELDIGSGGFPELEILTLDEVKKLQSIAGSSGTWDETKMSGLQILEFIDCPMLRSLPLRMEKLPQLKQINGELDWWQRLTWRDDQMKTRLSKLFMIL